jgi:hypothetical protein
LGWDGAGGGGGGGGGGVASSAFCKKKCFAAPVHSAVPCMDNHGDCAPSSKAITICMS